MRHLPTEILAAKDFAQSAGKADREQTRWRSEVDSNRRYRFWNFLTTALGKGFKSTSTNRLTSKRATIRWSLYRPFFRRSAQRFFIASDNRFLPSAVRRPRLLLFAVGAEAAAFPFEVAAGWVPSSAAMARLSRSLSLFNSATILSMSKIRSSGALLKC